ncbi:MAG: tRNA (adenosine(37)-N6)-dimethylallyltransferase MiaA [Ignavibacteriaceae bacterium]|nr:tRNA (adenosine(37)-N6)-dimethylallyltransferase MiaA [Ignavibacteriaceae bacterium]
MGTKVVVIVGPTCSGKTDISLKIAKQIPVEIISADSRQFYKYLDIGTAKPSAADLQNVKHHFIDEFDPYEEYNVSRFEKDALKLIDTVFNKGNIPLVVGGSGLYIKSLIDGIFDTVDTDENYRQELLQLKNKFGNPFLYEQLVKVDPESAAEMLPQNWKRIMRALEVYHLTGKTIKEHQKNHKREVEVSFVQYGLKWEREILYKNIEQRVDEMIKTGLVDEVKKLLSKGYDKNLNSLNTVGYKEIISYIDGEITIERAVELIKRNTRRYAKRQMTWFNGDNRINWLDVSSKNDIDIAAEKIISIEGFYERKN